MIADEDISDDDETYFSIPQPQPDVPLKHEAGEDAAASSPDGESEQPKMVPLQALHASRMKVRAHASEIAVLQKKIGRLLEARLADQKIIQSLKKSQPNV